MDTLDLTDWRMRIARLYLSGLDLQGFRRERDDLFGSHPQSPVEDTFTGLKYFAADPAYVVDVDLVAAEGSIDYDTGETDGTVRYRRVGIAQTPFGPLTLWWMQGYGGGLFLPFRDSTCGEQTYGGGRYLTDTVKGTHGRGVIALGGGRVRLDFNYAYNPSCAYSSRWTCPLAPPENRLEVPITAGEQIYGAALSDFLAGG